MLSTTRRPDGQSHHSQSDENLKARLRLRAARNGCSMEQEVREILRSVVLPAASESNFVERIRARFNGTKLDALSIPKRRPARVPRPPALEGLRQRTRRQTRHRRVSELVQPGAPTFELGAAHAA